MTPLPKKKHAKSRTRTRKSTIALRIQKLVTCPNCQNLKFPHHACPNCGYYSTKIKLPIKANAPKAYRQKP